MRDIETHQNANQSYIEEGIRLLELAHRAHVLFEHQPPAEKRKLLDFVLSNCRWKDGQLEAEYRKPFDLLAVAVTKDHLPAGVLAAKTGNFELARTSGHFSYSICVDWGHCPAAPARHDRKDSVTALIGWPPPPST